MKLTVHADQALRGMPSRGGKIGCAATCDAIMTKLRCCLALWLALGARPAPAAGALSLQPGPPFDYAKLAFQPKSWEKRGLSLLLTPWMGSNVVFLTTNSALDPGLMGIWVSRLEAGWQLYADLTGRAPSLFRHCEGKVTIAAVPGYDLTCGAGCGYVGVTGIELAMFYDHNYPELKTHPNAMPHYVFYEMGRNYYTFGDRHSCFITGFAVFMRYVCMDALNCEDRDAGTRQVIESVEPLLASSGLSFLDLFTMSTGVGEKVSRIRDARGRVVAPSDQPVRYAAAMLRLRRENGGDAWVQRFFHELASCPKTKPNNRQGALSSRDRGGQSIRLAARPEALPDRRAREGGHHRGRRR